MILMAQIVAPRGYQLRDDLNVRCAARLGQSVPSSDRGVATPARSTSFCDRGLPAPPSSRRYWSSSLLRRVKIVFLDLISERIPAYAQSACCIGLIAVGDLKRPHQ